MILTKPPDVIHSMLEADVERVASRVGPPEPVVVFEADSCQIETTDVQGLLCGIQPRGSGDWDCTITATPKPLDSGDVQCFPYAEECENLESVMLDFCNCDYVYICPTGACEEAPWYSHEATESCPCWQAEKHIPQNVQVNCEWDGNSGEVSWETDTHFFEMDYSTS